MKDLLLIWNQLSYSVVKSTQLPRDIFTTIESDLFIVDPNSKPLMRVAFNQTNYHLGGLYEIMVDLTRDYIYLLLNNPVTK